LKQKATPKITPPKPAAKPLWPWFSFILFVFSFAFIPFCVKADVTPVTKSFSNALSISFSPTQTVSPPQFQAGQSLTVVISLSDSNAASSQSKNGYTLESNACPASSGAVDYDSCSVKGNSVTFTAQPNLGTGSTSQNFTILLPATGFQSGAYNLFFDMQYVDRSTPPAITIWNYNGSSSVSITAATQGANAVLKIQPPTSGQKSADGAQVVGKFGISFTPAAGGAAPDHFVYSCGNGSLNPTTGSVPNTQANSGFNCVYPSSQSNYIVTLTAYASSDSTQPIGNPATSPFSVTGNETAQGGAGTGTPPAGGSSLVTFLNEIVAFVLASIQQLIYGIFFLLVSPVIVAVLGIHAYQDTFVAVIYSGWETIRNLCDIFFIVALIVIAMATLFRVESYKARHLLVQLIIAALMINFSLVIGQSILAVADTVQAQFLPADAASVNALAYKLMTTNNSSLMIYLQGQQNANASATNSGIIGGLVASVFWVALSLGSLAVFGAIAAFLVIRVIALWLLLMISPVAYAVGVLPSTAHYRDEWWKNFLKYAFFTPIMAFFLNIAALMATNATVNSQLQTAANNATIFNGQNGLASLIVTLGSNILLLVFLIASLKVADLAGIYGASGITDIAKKGIYAPFGVAQALSQAGAQKLKTKYDEKTLGLAGSTSRFKRFTYGALHAPSYVKAIGADSQKEREKMKHLTEAASLKVKRQTPFLKREGRDPLYHAQLEQGEERLNEVYGHYTGNETEEVRRLEELERKARGGDRNAQMMLMAQMLRAAPNKHLNQFMQNKGLDYSQPNIIGLLNEWEHAGIMSKSINEEFQTALSEQGYKISDFTLTELSDGKNEIHVEKALGTNGKMQYAVVGQDDWEAYNEFVRTHTANQADYKAMQKGLLTDPAYATQKAAFLADFASGTRMINKETRATGTRNFNEHNYQNAAIAQEQILKRDVNASKLERKPAIFHNSLATTDSTQSLNADGNAKVVFGEAGNHVLTHLAGTDVWGASRGQWTEKQKEWMYQMVKDHDMPAIKKMVETEYKKEVARKGVYQSDADITRETNKKTASLLATIYASKFQAGTDQVIEQVKAVTDAAGVAANPNKYAKKGSELETIFNDVDLDQMVTKIRT